VEEFGAVRVNVLGPFEFVDDNARLVSLTGGKQRALLALLALNAAHTVSIDRLINDLWGDSDLADVGNALQNQVSRLRKAVGREHLQNRGAGYVLDLAPEDVDAVRFEQLAREGRAQLRLGRVDVASTTLTSAHELWRGAALAELDDEWARRAAVRLEQLRLDALEDRFDADLALGRHHDVITELVGLVDEFPYRERLWGQLMIGLYRCGRQTDALAAFARARAALSEEHGLDPGPDLRALEQDVLNQDPRLDWVPAPAVVASAKAAEPVVTTNLPAPITSFIGRGEQLAQLARQVGADRLVTLTGAGGSGKTRLAIECARALQGSFADGVWMVELASLTDPSGVAAAVASALAGGDAGSQSSYGEVSPGALSAARLADHLRSRRLLIVLDNCEHVLAGVAEWADTALASSPGLHVLATSREPLGITGEVQWPVPPLTLPERHADDPDELARSEAVQLFADRSRRVGTFQLTAESVAAVAGLCRHLDGLPLAIELAAARTKALPVTVIADALVDRFQILVSTSKTAPARQRTLRGAVDWSYDLLDDDERRVFELTSVFDGGCSLDAVADLAATAGIDAHRTVSLLVGLVDKSLVVPLGLGATNARYDLLETLREYGREQLASVARLDDARRAHRAFFVALAEKAEAGLVSREHRSWFRRLEQEFANLRAAYNSAMTGSAWEDAIRIATALWWFWATTNRHSEGRAWLDAALDAVDGELDPTTHARALTMRCYLAGQLLDFPPAIAAGEQAIALAAGTGDEWATAWAKHSLALTLLGAGERDRSARLLADARAVWDTSGDNWRVASADMVTCVAALIADDLDVVDAASAEVLQRVADLDYEPYRCWGHQMRAVLAMRRGDLTMAVAEADHSLASAWRLELRHFVAFALTQRGRVALLDGDEPTAEAAFREAIAIAETDRAEWFASLARVGLAETYRRQNDETGATALLHEVLEWGYQADARHSGGGLFRALGGDPVARAAALTSQDAFALQR
jgi:predicted ATPase/DNA-binding SARP family transcriptional activator